MKKKKKNEIQLQVIFKSFRLYENMLATAIIFEMHSCIRACIFGWNVVCDYNNIIYKLKTHFIHILILSLSFFYYLGMEYNQK